MKDLTARTECSVFVENKWLDEKQTDKNAYFDQKELLGRGGAYYHWYKAKYGVKKADALAARANFTQTGIRVNDATHGWVNCRFTSDLYNARRYFTLGCTHPNGVSRVYAHRTSARGIELVGLAGNIS